MKIFVFKRPDGSLWADYSNLGERDGYTFIRYFEATDRGSLEELMKSPGEFVPERVRALAARSLAELLARGQQPPVTRQQHAVAVAQVEQWGFLRRLKWLATGK